MPLGTPLFLTAISAGASVQAATGEIALMLNTGQSNFCYRERRTKMSQSETLLSILQIS